MKLTVLATACSQFLTQPQDATVSCNAIPPVAEVSVQVAPAAIAYYNLLPESCYDSDTQVPLTFTESVIPGNCPGNYTIQRFWKSSIATDLKTNTCRPFKWLTISLPWSRPIWNLFS